MEMETCLKVTATQRHSVGKVWSRIGLGERKYGPKKGCRAQRQKHNLYKVFCCFGRPSKCKISDEKQCCYNF